MPCGLLYSAVLVAALSGGAWQGALSMAAFAVGGALWLLAAGAYPGGSSLPPRSLFLERGVPEHDDEHDKKHAERECAGQLPAGVVVEHDVPGQHVDAREGHGAGREW